MSIVERIRLDDSQYQARWHAVNQTVRRSEGEHRRAFGAMRSEMRQTQTRMSLMQKTANAMGTAMKYALGGLATAGALALSMALRNLSREQIAFDQKMTESLAIMGRVTQAQRTRMEKTAREVARELNMSADKVAESYFFLASAGLDAEQSIKALPAVARFARAGMFDMATATDLATDAQSALGMTVKDSIQNLENLNRITDVLVKANTLANATVQQFAEAMTNRAGASMRLLNMELEEGVAVLSALADQGIKGASAGNSLAIVLRDLQRTWGTNREAMERYGVTVFDQEGNFRSMVDIVADLERAMEGLTDEGKRQAFEQMGFQDRSMIFIQTLLGTSDAIANYRDELRQAQGITQEVADNQLTSITQRWQLMWGAIKDTLGPPFLALMSRATDAIEDFGKDLGYLYDRFAGTDTDRLLSTLKALDADPILIARLEKQQAIEQAQDIVDAIEEELREIEIPVQLNERDLMSQMAKASTRFARFFTGNPISGRGEGPLGALAGIATEFRNFEFGTEAFDPKEIGRYTDTLMGAKEMINDMSSEMLQMKQNGEAVPEVLVEQVQAYKDMIKEIERVLRLNRDYQIAQQALSDAQNQTVETTRTTTEETKKAEPAFRRVMEYVNGVEGALFNLKVEGRDVSQMFAGMGGQGLEEFNRKMIKLQNDLSAGLIDREEFDRRVAQMSESYQNMLRDLYLRLRELGVLTPELEKAFRKAFSTAESGAKDAKDEVESLADNLASMADAIDAVRQLGKQMGFLGDEMGDALDASSTLIRNLSRLNELKRAGDLGGLSSIVPMVGAIAGGITLISSISGMLSGGGRSDSEVRKQMRDLQLSIQDLQRAVERNTDAFERQGIVGGGIRPSDLARAMELVQVTDMLGSYSGPTSEAEARSILRELEELFPDFFSGIEDLFDEMIAITGDSPTAIIDVFRSLLSGEGIGRAFGFDLDGFDGITEILEMISQRLGEFGASIQGAMQEFELSLKFGTKDFDEALQDFIARLRDLDLNIPEEILGALEGIDLSTSEGQSLLEDLLKQLFEGGAEFRGDLTPDEYQDLLDFLQRLGDRADGAGEGFSRSVQISRTITEIQANEVVSLLFSILVELKGIHEVVRGEMAEVSMAPVASQTVQSTGNLFGDVNVHIGQLGAVSPADIDLVSEEIRKELINETLYRQF